MRELNFDFMMVEIEEICKALCGNIDIIYRKFVTFFIIRYWQIYIIQTDEQYGMNDCNCVEESVFSGFWCGDMSFLSNYMISNR